MLFLLTVVTSLWLASTIHAKQGYCNQAPALYNAPHEIDTDLLISLLERKKMIFPTVLFFR